MSRALTTGSLRWRVSRLTLLVVAGALLVVFVVIDVLYGVLARDQVEDRLADRAQFAVQMDARDVTDARIAERVSGNGVEARVVSAGGTRYQGGTLTSSTDTVTLTRELSDGSTLTLLADTGVLYRTRTTLRVVMIVGGLAVLGAVGLLVPLITRRTTRPLDTIADLASAVARGERGHRLRPERTDTELGRAAAAFDTMLDSLEDAERRAHDSESRSRRFLADVAHELRTPLAGVQATTEAVLHAPDTQPREEHDRLVLMLARESRSAGRLLDDLLLLARVDAGLELHHEPVDLLALCAAEVDRVRLRAPDVRVTVTGEETIVPGDAHRLGQVVANLVDNARRHGAAGVADPAITVTVTGDADHAGDAGRATVDIADTGPGIAPSQREMIFHRFVRTTGGDPGGTGLGLAIARGIARAHGGDLRCVETPPGAPGAVFRLTLPTRPAAIFSGSSADS